jgi:hypothetical protein
MSLSNWRKKRTLAGSSYTSLFSQPKIFMNGTITATTTPTTITHNLGYKPYFKLWAEQLTGEITIPVLVSAYTSYHSRYIAVPNVLYYATDTTLVIYTDTGTALTYYRIYTI